MISVDQVPHISGIEAARRLIPWDAGVDAIFQADRHARAQGKEPAVVPVVAADASAGPALPMRDAYDFFMKISAEAPGWDNKVTVRTLELFRGYSPGLVIDAISPTPLLMIVQRHDIVTPADLATEAYSKAREPKDLLFLPGNHFDLYSGKNMEAAVAKEAEFMQKWLV